MQQATQSSAAGQVRGGKSPQNTLLLAAAPRSTCHMLVRGTHTLVHVATHQQSSRTNTLSQHQPTSPTRKRPQGQANTATHARHNTAQQTNLRCCNNTKSQQPPGSKYIDRQMQAVPYLLWHRWPVRNSESRTKEQANRMPVCGTHTYVVSDALPHVPTHHKHTHTQTCSARSRHVQGAQNSAGRRVTPPDQRPCIGARCEGAL